MSIRIVSESTLEPISVDEAGFNLRAADDGNSPPAYIEAATIERLIKVAREVAEEETELSILERTYELTTDCFGEIELPRPPVHSIESVKYIDVNGVEQTLSTAIYMLDNRAHLRPAMLRLKYEQSWPDHRRESGAIRVRYVAGFRLEDSPPLDVVPESLRQAMHLLIAHYWSNREAVGADLRELPMGVCYLLGKYRVGLGV